MLPTTVLEHPQPGEFMPEFPGLITPYSPHVATASAALTANNQVRGVRVMARKYGVLKSLSIWIATSSGNARLMVFDTGDALNGSRSLLWDSGSTAVGTGNAWQTFGNPAIKVKPGQHLDFAVQADNTTATFGRTASPISGLGILPTDFLRCRGKATPKLWWVYSAGAFTAPSTIAEASVNGATNTAYCIIGRID